MGGAARPHGSHVEGAQRRRGRVLLLIAGVAALTLVTIMMTQWLDPQPTGDEADPPAAIVVGTPGGGIVETPVSSPAATPTATPSVEPTPMTLAPAPAMTPTPAPPQPTPAPRSQAPVATPQPATPTSTPVVVAIVGPDDTVALFYRRVTDGIFDAAYELWSDRMKAAYPRQENLDERFWQTEDIRFEALFVAERSATTALVQANFTEFYDTGDSRQFVGYWELVLVGDQWRLDAPHY
jgi:hypothetical protein